MARGYPDFFGFSIFPSFGELKSQTTIPVNIPDGVETTVFSILGKAIIFDGLISFDLLTNSPDAFFITTIVDGNTFNWGSLNQLIYHPSIAGVKRLVSLSYYDYGGAAYRIVIANEISILTSFVLNITQNTGVAVAPVGWLHYHEVL